MPQDGSYTYRYDDGSSITADYAGGTMSGVSSTPATDSGIGAWSQDSAEAAKFQQFYPQSDKPWYEQLAMFGATRAIDSHFAKTEVNKTAQPVTFAGQNGKTYAAGDTAPSPFSGSGGLLLIAAAAVAAVLILNK